MLDKIKKHDNWIVFLVMILISMGFTLCIVITSGDELWNFNNAYKFFSGYKMYTDMNIIIPPMFFYIVNIMFHLIGANILTFKIVGILIYGFTNLCIYNIFKALNINKKNAFCYLIMMQTIILPLVTIGANYNLLAIVFVLLGILLLIRTESESKYFWVLQGIITYLILFSKQNIGTYYLVGILMIEVMLKGLVKETIKQIIKLIGIISILSIFTMLYFYFQGNLYDFINYTVLGISEFTQNFSIDMYVLFLIVMDGIILFIGIFLCKKKMFQNEQKEQITILAAFSITLSFVIYPIINEYHIKLALILPFITLFYILHFLILEEFKLEKILEFISILILGITCIYSFYFSYIWILNAKFDLAYSHPYYGGVIEKGTEEKIEIINQYILQQQEVEKRVVILSEEAGLYLIPLQQNNGILDLPFLGNLGREGEDGLIKQIQKLESCHILLKQGDIFWQESQKTNDYIKQSYEKIGEIEDFDIYEIK